jgi:branched-chain amino acid transport system ATP-binding protein
VLALDNVDAFYGRVQALRGVSLTVGEGEMVALLGANGAGKTTTLRTISGLVKARAGTVTFAGGDITGASPEATARLGLAHIPEGRGVFGRMTVWQNLKMGGYIGRLNAAALNERIDEAIALFPRIGERLTQAAGTLSGGEQQMLAIARAIVAGPKLLLLDEPSHGLAPKAVHEVFALLARLRSRGVSLLVIEQYAAAALEAADRAYVLDRGRIALAEDADLLARDPRRLEAAYLGAAQ